MDEEEIGGVEGTITYDELTKLYGLTFTNFDISTNFGEYKVVIKVDKMGNNFAKSLTFRYMETVNCSDLDVIQADSYDPDEGSFESTLPDIEGN